MGGEDVDWGPYEELFSSIQPDISLEIKTIEEELEKYFGKVRELFAGPQRNALFAQIAYTTLVEKARKGELFFSIWTHIENPPNPNKDELHFRAPFKPGNIEWYPATNGIEEIFLFLPEENSNWPKYGGEEIIQAFKDGKIDFEIKIRVPLTDYGP